MHRTKTISYRFEYHTYPNSKDQKVLFDGINHEFSIKKGMSPIQPYGIFIKDSEGNVLGGINGVTYFGCLYIDMIWLRKELRQQGLGKKLMNEAEKIGFDRNCIFATLNTVDWEALPFYQKLGYEIEFVRNGYLNDCKMYFLRKNFKK